MFTGNIIFFPFPTETVFASFKLKKKKIKISYLSRGGQI